MSLRAKGQALLPELRALVYAGNLQLAHTRATAELADDYFSPMGVDVCEDILAKMPRVGGCHLVARILIGEGPKGRDERMVWLAAVYRSQLRDYRSNGFTIGLQIQPGVRQCARCSDIIGCWRIEAAPTIPNPKCVDEDGCKCLWLPIFKDEQPATPWRA